MTKIKLVYSQLGTFNAEWLEPIIAKYIELIPYSEELSLNNSVYITKNPKDPLLSRFDKTIIDNLTETPFANSVSGMLLECSNWFWYNESLWWQYLGYHNYRPQRSHQYRALMPMRLSKNHRDTLLKQLEPWLDSILWSYVAHGRTLPNDVMTTDLQDRSNERYFRPEWYDNTDFSIVAESGVTFEHVFITEKTYKPIAFYHPFLILGIPGTLARLRILGFETFDNIFDESYDKETDWNKRLDTIKNQIPQWSLNNFTPETVKRLEHNHAHFFNHELVIDKITQEVIEPILHYAETR